MNRLWTTVAENFEQGRSVVLSTVIQGVHAGKCGLYSQDGQLLAGEDQGLTGPDLFVDALHPRPCLVILGGGHVAVPVARIGSMVGFEVIVNDDRQEFANHQRFPQADRILAMEHQQALAQLKLDSRHYVVIVTRGHIYDRDCLAMAMATEVSYIGVIGSTKKATEMKQWLRDQGYSLVDIERVFSPIGLDIKAETPEEIAVSIMAEVIRERRRRPSSADIDAIATAIKDKPRNEAWALMTVVRASGSTPRGSGSRMLVTSRGSIGSVGGGPCEKEALEVAQEVMTTGIPRLLEFHLDNKIAAQEGGICGGSMTVFVQAMGAGTNQGNLY